jgi:hypothetical protein
MSSRNADFDKTMFTSNLMYCLSLKATGCGHLTALNFLVPEYNGNDSS